MEMLGKLKTATSGWQSLPVAVAAAAAVVAAAVDAVTWLFLQMVQGMKKP